MNGISINPTVEIAAPLKPMENLCDNLWLQLVFLFSFSSFIIRKLWMENGSRKWNVYLVVVSVSMVSHHCNYLCAMCINIIIEWITLLISGAHWMWFHHRHRHSHRTEIYSGTSEKSAICIHCWLNVHSAPAPHQYLISLRKVLSIFSML